MKSVWELIDDGKPPAPASNDGQNDETKSPAATTVVVVSMAVETADGKSETADGKDGGSGARDARSDESEKGGVAVVSIAVETADGNAEADDGLNAESDGGGLDTESGGERKEKESGEDGVDESSKLVACVKCLLESCVTRKTLEVALVCLSNGSDNIAIYLPLFAVSNSG